MSTWKVCETFRAGLRRSGTTQTREAFSSLDQSRKASWKKNPGFLDDVASSRSAQELGGRGRMVLQATGGPSCPYQVSRYLPPSGVNRPLPCPALQLPDTAPRTCSSTLWAMRVAPSSSSAMLMGRTRSATWEGRPDT